MAVPGYCEHCGLTEPVTYPEVERDPGYWRDKRELIASEIRALKADPCGEACYLAPIHEYLRTLYPYNLFWGVVRPRDVPAFCWTRCGSQCGSDRATFSTLP